MLKKMKLYFHTARYLKPQQILWRIWRRLGGKCRLEGVRAARADRCVPICGLAELDFDSEFLKRFSTEDLMNGRVCFLHEQEEFSWEEQWHFQNRSALWNFNLHYFEFLMPLTRKFLETKDSAYLAQTVRCIRGWIHSNPQKQGGDGWAGYTLSLRLTNWMSYYAAVNECLDEPFRRELEDSLFEQYRYLSEHLERDILGNHYFENLKTLVLCALFFDDRAALPIYVRALEDQCRQQILPDGMHFERSPMYHKLMLESLMRAAAALRQAQMPNTLLEGYVKKMLDAAYSMEQGFTRLPLFNDCGTNITKSLSGLLAAAKRCFDLEPEYRDAFPDGGYYIFRRDKWTMVVDAGPVGPTYIPGHGHCDAMSFELFRDGEPYLVNCGTYGYQCAQREYFRSTEAHNTVQVVGTEQSELWSTFRVARRSKTTVLHRSDTGICMELRDYRGNRIRRQLELTKDALTITDSAAGMRLRSHLHSLSKIAVCTDGELQYGDALYAPEYGRMQTIEKISVTGVGEVSLKIPLA